MSDNNLIDPELNMEVLEDASVKSATQEMIDAMATYVVNVMSDLGIDESIRHAVAKAIYEEVPQHLDYMGGGLDEWWSIPMRILEDVDPDKEHFWSFFLDGAGSMIMCERVTENDADEYLEFNAYHHLRRLQRLLVDQAELADKVCKWADLSGEDWRRNAADALRSHGKSDEALQVLDDPLREVELRVALWRDVVNKTVRRKFAESC